MVDILSNYAISLILIHGGGTFRIFVLLFIIEMYPGANFIGFSMHPHILFSYFGFFHWSYSFIGF